VQVILQKDIKNLGYAGDIVSVKPGYARNFLFPKNQALPVSKGTKAQVQHQNQLIEVKKKKALALRMTLVDKLKGVKLEFKKEADSKGRLFGSVSAFVISKQLEAQELEVDKRAIKLEKPLKLIGEHQVLVDMGKDLKAELIVNIIPIVSAKKMTKHTEDSKEPKKVAKDHGKEKTKASSEETGKKSEEEAETSLKEEESKS